MSTQAISPSTTTPSLLPDYTAADKIAPNIVLRDQNNKIGAPQRSLLNQLVHSEDSLNRGAIRLKREGCGCTGAPDPEFEAKKQRAIEILNHRKQEVDHIDNWDGELFSPSEKRNLKRVSHCFQQLLEKTMQKFQAAPNLRELVRQCVEFDSDSQGCYDEFVGALTEKSELQKSFLMKLVTDVSIKILRSFRSRP